MSESRETQRDRETERHRETERDKERRERERERERERAERARERQRDTETERHREKVREREFFTPTNLDRLLQRHQGHRLQRRERIVVGHIRRDVLEARAQIAAAISRHWVMKRANGWGGVFFSYFY